MAAKQGPSVLFLHAKQDQTHPTGFDLQEFQQCLWDQEAPLEPGVTAPQLQNHAPKVEHQPHLHAPVIPRHVTVIPGHVTSRTCTRL
jgi:hypothetical protein